MERNINNDIGFHCVIHASPPQLPAAKILEIRNVAMSAVTLPRLETRFRSSFEFAAKRMEKLPRFFFEPDGSFVWVVEQERRFQLDGSLYDDGQYLVNVELKGSCTLDMLDEFLSCLGWPDEAVLFQLVQRGIYLSETEFRRHFVYQ